MSESNEEFTEENSQKYKFWLKIKKLFQTKPKTTEEMVAIVEAASEDAVIDKDAERMISGALEVSAMQTGDIMIPRTQMNVLKADDTFTRILRKLLKPSIPDTL